jgi:hypothetical protein
MLGEEFKELLVAELWQEQIENRSSAMSRDGKECKNP